MHGSPDPLGSRRGDDTIIQQPSLFDIEPTTVPARQTQATLVRLPVLTPDTTLGGCPLPYADYLRRTNHSKNTVACFLSDLRLLTRWLGSDRRLVAITPKDLKDWLDDMEGRLRPGMASAAPPETKPKTMARRVTFLKNFFGWLAQEHVLAANPADAIALRRPTPPLPELLFDDEVTRLEAAAAEDVRCQLLVALLLEAGLKKEEVLGLRLQDVDLSNPEQPAIEVHFPGQDKRRRERRMLLPAVWADLYQRYLGRFHPAERVFECTGRNLNYVLAAAVRRAKIEKPVTLQLLRDVYAVRQLRGGVAPEVLREKLGLSDEAWYETAEKYRKLAFPA